MAASSSAQMLEQELSCHLCREYYTEPVSVDCGHSFCRVCIDQYWEKWGSDFSCPRCGQATLKRKLRPNKELANVVAIIGKRMKLEMAERASGEKMCETHQQPLQFFCQHKRKLLCATCAESQEDPRDALLSLEDAVRTYKEQLDSLLETWKEKREEVISFHTEEEERYKELQEKVNMEKQKFVSKFEELEVYLKQEKTALLDQLEEFVKSEETLVTRLSDEIYLCDAIIQEMEDKSHQTSSTFLQDIEKTLQRCRVRDFQKSDICSDLEEQVNCFSKKCIILQDSCRQFKEHLSQQLQVKWVNVTLDPDTAHSQLTVSADQKTLTWAEVSHNRANYPQRFISSCVLGCEGFTSGRHYWEVKVGSVGCWAVGVARESVSRDVEVTTKAFWMGERLELKQSPEGIWALRENLNGVTYAGGIPKTIGIYLDYEGGRVLFYNADNDEGNVLYTFPSAQFKAEKVRPFFWLRKYKNSIGRCSISLLPPKTYAPRVDTKCSVVINLPTTSSLYDQR